MAARRPGRPARRPRRGAGRHPRETYTFDLGFCGVDGTYVIALTRFARDTATGYRFIISADGRFTATDGRTVTIHAAGLTVGAYADNGDGTYTYTTDIAGLPAQIRGSGGSVTTRDAGLITFAITVDMITDQVLSIDVVAHGPHPDAGTDINYPISCDAFLTALG